jgi:hypothetical protein
MAMRCSKELTSQILPNSKVPRIFSEFLITFYPYTSMNFNSDSISNLETFPIRKVDPYFKFFPTTFYFKFLERGKVSFELVKVWRNSNFI